MNNRFWPSSHDSRFIAKFAMPLLLLAAVSPHSAWADNASDVSSAINSIKASAAEKTGQGAKAAGNQAGQSSGSDFYKSAAGQPAAKGAKKGESGGGSGQRASLASELKRMMDEPGQQPEREKKSFSALIEESEAPSYPSVLPEITTKIELSSSDVNRLSCQNGDIKDVSFSEEKGVMVKFTAKDAFVKFAIKKRGEETIYSTTPSEFYVVCGDDTYNLVLLPKRIPAQVVKLSSGKKEKLKANIGIFAGMPFEKKILTMVQQVYTDELSESYTVETPNRQIDFYADLDIVQTKQIAVEGEGVRLKEFAVRLKGSQALTLTEKDFLRTEFTRRPVAISVDKLHIGPGEVARVIIAEMAQEADK